MPVSALETLMQIATPPRAVEPPAPSPGGSAFGPALAKAYTAEKPRDSAPPAKEGEELRSAADSTDDSNGADEERTDEAATGSETAAPTEEEDQGDEELSEDEVEISELASTAAAAGEAQAAAAAQQESAATEIAGEGLAASGGASSEDGEQGEEEAATAPPTEADVESAKGKALGHDSEFSATAGESGDGDVQAAKGGLRAKWLKIDESDQVESPATTQSSTSDNAAGDDVELSAADPQVEKPKLTELKASGESTGSETGESKDAKGENVQRLPLPPTEQTAELTAAIERHVALMEQSAPAAADAASVNSAAPEAVGAAPTAQRSAATLDRLAAASMRRGDGASSAEGGPSIDRPRFLQRVEGALRAAQQRDGRVQVRLAPPELGSLRIELSVQNGAMTAKLEAETPAARNALLDNLPALRERLAEQNIRVEKFDVDIRRDSQGSGGNGGPQDSGQRQDDPDSQQRRPRVTQPPAKSMASRSSTVTSTATTSGLDIRI